jgi:ketosteroid isomerase-like protein
MKTRLNRSRKWGVSALVISFALPQTSCDLPSQSAAPPEPSLPPALTAAIDSFYQTIESDSHEARIGLFSDDALMMPNHGDRIEGKAAIAEVIRAGEDWVFRLRNRTRLDEGFGGNVAYTVNAYDYTYHPAGEDPNWHATKNVHIWKRDSGGEWKLHVDIWNADEG